MPSKIVSDLKVGDRIWTAAAKDTINYNTWSKISKLETIRAYSSANPGKQIVVTEIFFKPEKGPLAGEELSFLLRDDYKVTIPPKPGKFRQILNILFT